MNTSRSASMYDVHLERGAANAPLASVQSSSCSLPRRARMQQSCCMEHLALARRTQWRWDSLHRCSNVLSVLQQQMSLLACHRRSGMHRCELEVALVTTSSTRAEALFLLNNSIHCPTGHGQRQVWTRRGSAESSARSFGVPGGGASRSLHALRHICRCANIATPQRLLQHSHEI